MVATVDNGHHQPNTAFAQHRGNMAASPIASAIQIRDRGVKAVPDLNASLM